MTWLSYKPLKISEKTVLDILRPMWMKSNAIANAKINPVLVDGAPSL